MDSTNPLNQEDWDSEETRKLKLQRFVQLMKIEKRVLKKDELNKEIGNIFSIKRKPKNVELVHEKYWLFWGMFRGQ